MSGDEPSFLVSVSVDRGGEVGPGGLGWERAEGALVRGGVGGVRCGY